MEVSQGETTGYVGHFLEKRHFVWTGELIVVRTYARTITRPYR